MTDTKYEFTLVLDTKNFEVRVDPEAQYGYFEHHRYGDEQAGGLWFADKVLLDYDGVYELPKEIEDALSAAGFDLSDI